MKKTILICICLTLFTLVGHGKDYHVTTTGKDSNAGSSKAPFRTIQRAANIMTAGDTCYIHAGTYYECVKPANSGAEGSSMVFTAFRDDQVVVNGGKPLTGWTKYTGSIYKVAIVDSVKELFVNRQFMLWARHPNMPYDPVKGFDMCKPTLGTANPPSNVDWAGVTVIQSNDKEGWWNTVRRRNDYVQLPDSLVRGGWLMGVPGLIDSEGEWCWKAGVLYLWPPKGKNPESLLVEGKIRDLGFDLSDRNYIILRKITVFGTTISMNNSSHCILDDCKVFYLSSIFSTSTYNINPGSKWSPISGNLPGKGILVNGSYNVIQNCEIAHSWGNCVTILGSNNRVYNCEIYDACWQAWECAVISINGGGHVIRRNTLHDSQRSVISMTYRSNTTPLSEANFIDSNEIYNAGLEKTDNGGFYCFSTNGNGTIISYNWVHDSYNGYSPTLHSGIGIYLDDYSSNFIVHHNVIWNAKTGPSAAGIKANNPKSGQKPELNRHQIYNNTMWDCKRALNSPDKDWNGTTGRPYWAETKVFNNILIKPETFGPAMVGNNYIGNEVMFADTINRDFRLKAGSPCIDAGTVIPGITDGFKGSAPDIGAYEYGVVFWKPGRITGSDQTSAINKKSWK
jgi:hypothetical protein